MKQEQNNEIDLLLRQLAGRDGIPVSEANGQHLDADELNSYVANALPAKARARYMEHLADCSNCRKTVAQLSAAQGPVTVQQSAGVVAPSGFKSFLASLLSPLALRYAVPALAVLVIAAVGVFVLRQERQGESVAMVNDTDQNRSVEQRAAPAQTPDANLRGVTDSGETPKERTATPVAKDAPASDAPAQEGPVTKSAPVANEPQPVASAAAPPPAPKPAVGDDATPREAEAEKKQKQAEADQNVAAVRDERRQRTDEVKEIKKEGQREEQVVTVTPGRATKADVEVSRAKNSEAGGPNDSMKRAPKPATGIGTFSSAAETRSVAGRRFRKSGNIWIDTAYDSSQEITSLSRGSDRYRALVADEPAIRTIADELDGEVIVVWKGRTYRIR